MFSRHLHPRLKRDSLPLPEEYVVDDVEVGRREAEPEANPEANPEPVANPQQMTVTSIHYVTLAPTFSGAIAGYTTPGVVAQPTTIQAPPSSAQPTTESPPPVSTSVPQTFAVSTSVNLPSSILSSSSAIATGTLVAVSSASQAKTTITTTIPLSSATSSSTSLASTSSSDMSTGAKAGIAIAVIILVGAIAALVIFCTLQRRKRAEHQRLEDEKHDTTNDLFAARRASVVTSRTAKTASTAPRLSLRPVTQFLPGFSGNQDNRRTSRGNALYPQVGPGAVQMTPQRSSPAQSAWERPMNSDNYNQSNPFGNHAEAVDPVNAAGPAVVESPTAEVEKAAAADAASSVGGVGASVDGTSGAEVGTKVAVAATAVAVGAGAGAAVGLVRGTSKRGNGPKPLDFTKSLGEVGPPSPAGTDFSVSEVSGTPVPTGGAAAIAAAGGPHNSAVHRVQLDFKPSMDDELELRAGQLVRLLHEYDDGWALCIRLDRSQQGVVPRTCLSTRPVKPRPANGPRGQVPPNGMRGPPQGRPMSAVTNMGQRSASPAPGRSMSPAMGQRSASPAPGRLHGPQARPASPAGSRPSAAGSPHGPQGRPPMDARSNSPSPVRPQDRQNTPPATSSPPRSNGSIGRKPVPGQAI